MYRFSLTALLCLVSISASADYAFAPAITALEPATAQLNDVERVGNSRLVAVGERGLVTAPLERALAQQPASVVYTCGPEGMLEAVAGVAARAGVPCQVALGAPMACGMGTCKGCAVMTTDGTCRYVCYDGPVFPAEQIYAVAMSQ